MAVVFCVLSVVKDPLLHCMCIPEHECKHWQPYVLLVLAIAWPILSGVIILGIMQNQVLVSLLYLNCMASVIISHYK